MLSGISMRIFMLRLDKIASVCYSSSGAFLRRRFVRIPRINEHATVVIVTFPKEIDIPPTPVIKITEATNKFLFLYHIDNEALTEALREKKIWGAAIDCWEQEPLDPNDPLLSLDNVITT